MSRSWRSGDHAAEPALQFDKLLPRGAFCLVCLTCHGAVLATLPKAVASHAHSKALRRGEGELRDHRADEVVRVRVGDLDFGERWQ
jgi:cytochrome c5